MDNSAISDVQAEAAVIATLVYHPEFILHSEYLRPGYFYNIENGCTYWAIQELYKAGIDTIDALNISNMLNSNKAVKRKIEEYNLTDMQEFINMAQYAGQNYLNFCYFWEKANYDHITAERELPMTYHYLFHIDNDDYRRSIRSGQQGFFMSVFASYIGDVMLDLSPIGMVLWCTLFFLIIAIVLKYPRREQLYLGEYMAFFALSAIPIFGVFYYRYMAFPYSFMLIIVVLLFFTDKYDFHYSSSQESEKEITNI